MRSYRALGALATALVFSLSSGLVRAEDDPAAKFKADLAKLLDRYNDEAVPGRTDKLIALCNARLAVKADDAAVRLELARFKLAKDDFDGAVVEAEKVVKEGKGDEAKQGKALALAAVIGGAEAALPKEKDPEKQKALQEELQKKVSDHEKALIESAGSEEAAIGLFSKEQESIEKVKELAEVGNPPRAIEKKKDTADKEIKLDSYAGKVLLIDFWATWCGPCVGELPNVLATYEKWNAKGFEVLGISLDEDRALLDTFVKENKVPWRQYFDGKGWENEIAAAWGVKSIPKTYLVDHAGKVRYVGIRGPELEVAVKELIERADKASKGKNPEPTK